MSAIRIDNELFFAEVAAQLAEGKRVRMRARGNSMLPMIRHEQDSVTLQAVSDDSFRRGSLLLVRLPQGHYVLHRLVRVEGDELLLRGDGNLDLTERCSRSDVMAEAVEVLRGKRTIRKGDARWWGYWRLWPRQPLMRRVGLKALRLIYK